MRIRAACFGGGVVAAGWVLAAPVSVVGTLHVISVEPPAHSLGASVHTPIVVRFDVPVDRTSITKGAQLSAFGRWSGAVGGTYAFADGDTVVTLTPARPFSSGESVMVVLSHDIRGARGEPLRRAGYSFQFWTRARAAENGFVEADRLTTRSDPRQPTRAYGGVATDLDADGWLDVSVINEITADVRVFANRADGSGLLDPFLRPPNPVGARASPSEPSDFDRDGHADLCVANIDDDSVSILLGNGDGTFASQQVVPVGVAPRGIAVLDVDGDGDTDVVNTNSGPDPLNMSVLLNDGSGSFGPPSFFPSGGAGAWALAAGDMNDDGVLDLVVGAHGSQRILVHLGQGDGTFLPATSQIAGGAVWMLGVGDVNGDGTEDVASVNGTSDNGAIFLGDGTGALAPPVLHATGAFTLATDLGDTDGDGDLDWVTSSFSGDWLLFVNDGAGGFVLERAFVPAAAASCALPFDLDDDLDVDLALIDEIADELVLMRNGGIDPPVPPPDVPDGEGGTAPLRVGRLDPAGHDLLLSWDVVSCEAADYHLVHGAGSTLPAAPGGTLTPAGGRCGIGTNQPFAWLASPDPRVDPTGLVWFLLLASDGIDTEGSWGTDSSGLERNGPGPSGSSARCGIVVKDPFTACAGRQAGFGFLRSE